MTPNAVRRLFTAGSYSYEITAATAYGESEPSLPSTATVGANGSVTLDVARRHQRHRHRRDPGPTLAQEEATHTGGTGFWGYNIYRENPGATTYGLVGQVAENPPATSATTYSFTDTGATAPGAAPGLLRHLPDGHQPGHRLLERGRQLGCRPPAPPPTPPSSRRSGWTRPSPLANALPNYTPVRRGHRRALRSSRTPTCRPPWPATGITTFASDASRQPSPYSTSGRAESAPRYPSNIYYNASNWPDELNEYNTLYVAPATRWATPPTRRDRATAATRRPPPASPRRPPRPTFWPRSPRIMLSHVLANDPRVGYAHQTNLIGPAPDRTARTTATPADAHQQHADPVQLLVHQRHRP